MRIGYGPIRLLALCAILAMPVSSFGEEADHDVTLSPYFFIENGDPSVDQFPLKNTSVDVSISGVIASVLVTQTYINEGAIQRVGGEIAASEAGTAVLDEDVSPAQQNNLEDRWNVKLLNRSELILDIFAGRANTADGKLQVELAQHQYRLPRLRGQGMVATRAVGALALGDFGNRE